MPRKTLTQLAVDRIKAPPTGRVEYFDTLLPGFALRVTDKGHKSWCVFYRLRGRLRRDTIGTLAAVPKVEAARAAARDALQKARRGIDPVEERKVQAAAADAAVRTVGAVIDDYLAAFSKGKWRQSTYSEASRILAGAARKRDGFAKARSIKDEWGDKPIIEITREDVRKVIDAYVDRNAAVLANRVLGRLRHFFGWAIEKDYCSASPAVGVKPPADEISRERVLSDDEVRWFWKGCTELGWPFGQLFQLLLATAQRRDEVGLMEWAELDQDSALWTIPREKAKNNRTHDVPLSALACGIVKTLPQVSTRLVFTTSSGRRPRVGQERGKRTSKPSTEERPVSGFSGAKGHLDALMEKHRRKELGLPEDAASGIRPWRLHDLRRTAATGMAKLGIPQEVVEKLLNHVQGKVSGVAAIYNRHAYFNERRAAVAAWGDCVAEIVARDEKQRSEGEVS